LYNSNSLPVTLKICCIQYGGGTPNGQEITQATINTIKADGFNAVRIHIYWNVIQPTSGSSVNTAAFTSTSDIEPAGIGLDSIVNWCAQDGLYIILNPDWSSSYPTPTWVPTVANKVTTGDSGNSVDLFGNSATASGVAYLYGWMAAHYASDSNVIFEGFNELLDYSASTDATTTFPAFNEQWTNAIESNQGPYSHIIIIEALWDDSWNYYFDAPYVAGTTPSNLMIATHNYQETTTDPQTFANAIHAAGLPCICTEFGIANFNGWTNSQLTAWITATTTSMNNGGYDGWAWWCICTDPTAEGNWNLNNPTNAQMILPILFPT
jgi:hypothetical protein